MRGAQGTMVLRGPAGSTSGGTGSVGRNGEKREERESGGLQHAEGGPSGVRQEVEAPAKSTLLQQWCSPELLPAEKAEGAGALPWLSAGEFLDGGPEAAWREAQAMQLKLLELREACRQIEEHGRLLASWEAWKNKHVGGEAKERQRGFEVQDAAKQLELAERVAEPVVAGADVREAEEARDEGKVVQRAQGQAPVSACAGDPIDGQKPPYTPHILVTCPKVQDIWSALKERLAGLLPGLRFSEQFLLLHMALTVEQRKL